MKWRNVPLALRCGLVFETIQILGWLAYALAEPARPSFRIPSGLAGISFLVTIMMIVGTFDLARSLSGRVRLGGWLAFAGYLGSLAVTLAWAIVQCKQSWMLHRSVGEVLHYVSWGTHIVAVIGLAIASGNVTVGIVGAVVGLVTDTPFLEKRIHEAIGDRAPAGVLIFSAIPLLHTAALFVLALFAARTEPDAPDTRRVISGYRGVARSMWIRVIAAGAVPLVVLVVATGKPSSASLKFVQGAMITAVVVGLWSSVQFAFGVLAVARSRVSDAGPIAMLVAAIGALWCAGIALGQVPLIVMTVDGGSTWGESYAREALEAWSVAAPLLAIATVAMFVTGIAGLASRRGYHELHTEAAGKGVGSVILMFASFAIQHWALPRTTNHGTALVLMLGVLAAGLIGTVMMANLATHTADALESGPSTDLPTARVV